MSTPTLSSPAPPQSTNLNLSSLPPIFVLSTHMLTDDLVAIENQLTELGAPLTYDASEAKLFLGKVEQKRRVGLELGLLKVTFEEVLQQQQQATEDREPPRKKRRKNGARDGEVVLVEDSSTESEPGPGSEVGTVTVNTTQSSGNISPLTTTIPETQTQNAQTNIRRGQFLVLKHSWLEASIAASRVLPIAPFTVLEARRVVPEPIKRIPVKPAPSGTQSLARIRVQAQASKEKDENEGSIENFAPSLMLRAPQPPTATAALNFTPRSQSHRKRPRPIPSLLHQTTSEHDIGVAASRNLPPLPDWALARSTYSCKRATTANPPNESFIAQLLIIRKARKLNGDEIGVRAYSTSIASIAAYPYSLTSAQEILALPGCEGKIAALWTEWRSKNSASVNNSNVSSRRPSIGSSNAGESLHSKTQRLISGQVLVDEAQKIQDDERMKVLRLFYEIWGVGAKTARDFYDNGWRELDDIVEFGWDQLSRVQQIGVKYYDEFLEKIDRSEVEGIAETITHAARKVARDKDGVRCVIVGGYRRGKVLSGDVDVILSHTDESETLNFVQKVVRELMREGWITHELITHLSGSRREQNTLQYRADGGGHGFDNLDKSLVVWQDPNWDAPGGLTAELKAKKNPNVHRRVDIIIAPWSKIGCAVLGWTAGTTFERDLRRYVKKEKSWKFDSSGIRDRSTGLEIDAGMGYESAAEAERLVFERMGLVYREPWERCTY